MLKNYLRIARRYLLRYKTYTTINVLGLAVGVTCCILIMLFVRSEFSYDRWNAKAGRIYRVWQIAHIQGQDFPSTTLPVPAGPAIAESFPTVEASCRIYAFGTQVRIGNTSFNENITMADPSLFRIFDFQTDQRDRPFPTDQSLLLTPGMAQKYFGREDPVGRKLELKIGDTLQWFTVSGIVQPAPEESSIKFNMLISYANARPMFGDRLLTSWFNIINETYVLLKDKARAADLEKEFPSMVKQQLGKDAQANFELHLQPLTAIHLDTNLPSAYQAVSNPRYSYILGTIGILILLVACINFITLSIGRSTTRAVEVGVRKALGAGRKQLIVQFWGEALLLTLLAIGLGLVIAGSLLKPFNQLINRNLHFTFDGSAVLFFIVLAIVIAGIAGSYPSFILSGFRPVEVLKGRLTQNNNTGFFRKTLIVGQFVASIALLIGTMVIGKQLDFVQRRDLGFNKDQVIIIPTHKRRPQGYALAKLYMAGLRRYPQIAAASASTFSFIETPWADLGFNDQQKQHHTIQYNEIDAGFIEAMQIRLTQGRSFAEKNAADTNNSIVVNEALVKKYGLKDPIGKRFGVYSQRIVGVVKDFNYESLHTTVKPLVLSLGFDTMARQSSDLSYANGPEPRISIRLKPGSNLQENIALLKKIWEAVAPRQEFEYRFLDDRLAQAYEQERKSAVVVRIASGLSIFIACMGLFGLATLTVTRRTKELGVRKILGASSFQLVRLLSRDFIGLVLLAAVIATPVAGWAMHVWLADFAYRTEVSWWIFVVAGAAAVGIALMTISVQTLRAANANPVDSLRTE